MIITKYIYKTYIEYYTLVTLILVGHVNFGLLSGELNI